MIDFEAVAERKFRALRGYGDSVDVGASAT